MATPLPPLQKPPGDCDGCEDCAKSFRTLEQQKNPVFCYQAVLRDQTALRLHNRTMTSIFYYWKAIRELIEQHEDLIQERWQRKTRLERHEALKSAMQGRELQQELTIWFENPRKTTWLLSDNKRVEWLWSSGFKDYKVPFSDFLMNVDADSPDCYLLSKSPKPQCRHSLKIGFPRAVFLLKAQQTIMGLLKHVAQALIDEAFTEVKNLQPLLEGVWGFEPKYASSDREFCCPYLNEPFTEPRVFRDSCIRAITLKVRMRRDLVADHLHFLQTIWGNLHQTILETAAAMGTNNVDDVIEETVSALSYDIWNYWPWRSIFFKCEKIKFQGTALRNSRSQSKEAAGIEFEVAVQELSVLLDEQCTARASYIPKLLSSRAALSKYFLRQPEQGVGGVSEAILDAAQVARQDYLFHILWEISKIPSMQKPTKVDLDTAFGLFKEHTRQFSGEKDRIDNRLHSHLSDLAAIHDIQAKLEIRPLLADRASVRKFLDDQVLKRSSRQTSLSLDELKVRDKDFQDFTSPGFDGRCKALLKFFLVARLQQLERFADKDLSHATKAMHLFWLEMREKRLSTLQCAAQKIGDELSKDYIGNDLGCIFAGENSGRSVSGLEASLDGLKQILATDTSFGADPFGMLANHSRSQVWKSWTRTSLPTVAASSIENLVVNHIDYAQLVEINVPIKESFWSIFESVAGYSPTPILWKTFVAFMDDILGFQAWETYFDCSFVPRFHKRVFVGKGKGNNISCWKHMGAITFRIPTKGILERYTLITMFERLGKLFAENGIRVTFEPEIFNTNFDEDGKEIVNWKDPRDVKRKLFPAGLDPSKPMIALRSLWKGGDSRPEGYFAF